MPELPDIDILADAFAAALIGRPLEDFTVVQPLVVRGTQAELAALRGAVLTASERRGKFLTLRFGARDKLVVNAMLTGRLGLAKVGAKAFPQSALVLRFGPREPRAPRTLPTWTRKATWLPPDGESIELRYRDPIRMGKVYVLPNGVARPVAGWDELGPDVDDPQLDLEMWRQRIGRRSGEIKNLLKAQDFVAGIGNGYSDEILWEAQLQPFRRRSDLAGDEVDRLWTASRDVTSWAIAELRERVPPRFEVEQREYLKVHRKGGQACPRCGTTLSEISPGGFVTTFCRGCQR